MNGMEIVTAILDPTFQAFSVSHPFYSPSPVHLLCRFCHYSYVPCSDCFLIMPSPQPSCETANDFLILHEKLVAQPTKRDAKGRLTTFPFFSRLCPTGKPRDIPLISAYSHRNSDLPQLSTDHPPCQTLCFYAAILFRYENK